jgi:tRNA (cytidine/uridine-2'-O-)-methyltransferase
MRVVLVEPEIPPNTGSIGRLCAATDTPLHLVGRLGFTIDDKHLRRAGLDYWPHVRLQRHDDWAAFAAAIPGRRLGFSARAERPYTAIDFEADDVLVFGGETRGLPAAVRATLAPHLYRIPIASPHVRSLNLANAVAVVLYEALRQLAARRDA